jgi:hypothetical protein
MTYLLYRCAFPWANHLTTPRVKAETDRCTLPVSGVEAVLRTL